MYHKYVNAEQSDDLLHVVPAHKYISQLVGPDASPFKPLPIRRRFWMKTRAALVRLTEKIVGERLYIRNDFKELILLDPRSRALLTKLLKKGIVSSWVGTMARPDAPHIEYFKIRLAPVALPGGTTVYMDGSTGNGAGNSIQEAMVPALGELLERYSCTQWSDANITHGTESELRHNGAVRLDNFNVFSRRQLKQDIFKQNRFSENTHMDWVQARELENNNHVLVPAHLAYMFYNHAHPHEPMIWQASSNGAAAGTTHEMATYNAICELIERDAFMITWLNKISPPRLDIATVPIPRVRDAAKQIAACGLEFYILDITTDIQVPVFLGVTVDTKNHTEFHISGVAGFDIDTALVKLTYEVIKFLHHTDRQSNNNDLLRKPEQIHTIIDRSRYWKNPETVKKGLFLIQGPTTSYDDLPKNPPQKLSTYIENIRQIFKEKQYPCYLVNVTSDIARDAGVVVVRAIVPNLMQIYFNETQKPLGVRRLYTVPKLLGYECKTNEKELNTVPHPFL